MTCVFNGDMAAVRQNRRGRFHRGSSSPKDESRTSGKSIELTGPFEEIVDFRIAHPLIEQQFSKVDDGSSPA
jgi:hypothetical protein